MLTIIFIYSQSQHLLAHTHSHPVMSLCRIVDGTEDSDGMESSPAFSFSTTCPVNEPTSASASAAGPSIFSTEQFTPKMTRYYLQFLKLSTSQRMTLKMLTSISLQHCCNKNMNLQVVNVCSAHQPPCCSVKARCEFVVLIPSLKLFVTFVSQIC